MLCELEGWHRLREECWCNCSKVPRSIAWVFAGCSDSGLMKIRAEVWVGVSAVYTECFGGAILGTYFCVITTAIRALFIVQSTQISSITWQHWTRGLAAAKPRSCSSEPVVLGYVVRGQNLCGGFLQTKVQSFHLQQPKCYAAKGQTAVSCNC